MTDYVIDTEIQSLLNPLTDEEHSKLQESISKEGCRDAGVVAVMPDGTRILADGHNRRTICAHFDIDFKTVDLEFKDRESLIQWVIDNQFGRRNLTDERKAYYRGKEYLSNRKNPSFSRFPHNEGAVDDAGATAEKVADKYGVGRATIERDAKFAEAVDSMPEIEKEIVLSGNSDLSKKAVIGGELPKRCDRCVRTGNNDPKCPNCIEARKPPKTTTRAEFIKPDHDAKVKVTASKQNFVDAPEPDEMVDDADFPIPAKLRAAFSICEDLRSVEYRLNRIATDLSNVEQSVAYKLSGCKTQYSSYLITAAFSLRKLCPSIVHQDCKGDGCSRCGGKGYLANDEVKGHEDAQG